MLFDSLIHIMRSRAFVTKDCPSDGPFEFTPHDTPLCPIPPLPPPQVIRQQLSTPHGFVSASRELIDWCSDIRAFQPQYENGLMACLQTVSRFAASPGFDFSLGKHSVCSGECPKNAPLASGQSLGLEIL